ncbi:MAG: sulfotransferase family 2 domain-containing protein, partial [Proteobacteria bacterium]|nr:sulfotransferase family 2 domain-containing protein [Pseudomonadota bacterium]
VLRSILPAALWQSYFKFVFVRHPLDWFVSQYRYNTRRPRFPAWVLAQPWRARAALRTYRRAAARHEKRIYDAADVQRLHRHLKRYRGLPGTPTLLQSSYVHDTDGIQIVDFVGRFESLEEDVASVQRRIGIDFALPHRNRTDHPDYRDCFTDAGARKVRELWSVDFERLGYQAT